MGAMNGRRCATYAHAAAPRLCLERYYEDACVIAVEPPPPPPPPRAAPLAFQSNSPL